MRCQQENLKTWWKNSIFVLERSVPIQPKRSHILLNFVWRDTEFTPRSDEMKANEERIRREKEQAEAEANRTAEAVAKRHQLALEKAGLD